MIILKSNGNNGGQCDAKCYNANTRAKNCSCICGGMNHGKGWTQAIKNVQETREELEKKHGKEVGFTEHINQLVLF